MPPDPQPENSDNSQNEHMYPPDPEGTSPATQTPPRDPTYYLEDANTVFLVDGVLFKIQLSLLVPDSRLRNYEFDSCIKFLLNDSNAPITRKGASDADAVLISDISLRQFRHLLLALLGRPGDPDYMAFFTAAQSPDRHTQDAFVQYLDVGTLAHRFGMNNLGSWAQSQLRLLFKSARTLSNNTWEKDILLQTLTFGRLSDQQFAFETGAFVRFMLAPSISSKLPRPDAVNLGTCVSLYKDTSFLENEQTTFGWVVAVILSQGHLSDVWKKDLSLDHRLALYATRIEITECPAGYSSSSTIGYQVCALKRTKKTRCYNCSSKLSTARKSSFDQISDQSSPSGSIQDLVDLPYYRQVFAESIDSHAWSCGLDCRSNALDEVDTEIEDVFCRLSSLHKRFINDL